MKPSVAEPNDLRERVHGALRADGRERRRDVPAHPHVLFRVVEEVLQRGHHVVAVADEHLARRALQLSVPQQRDERGHEAEVLELQLAEALHRLLGDAGVAVVEQRNQQVVEAIGVDLADGRRDVTPDVRTRRIRGELGQRGFGGIDVRRLVGCGPAPPRRSPPAAGRRHRGTAARDRRPRTTACSPARRRPPSARRRRCPSACAARWAATGRRRPARRRPARRAPASAPAATRGRAAAA